MSFESNEIVNLFAIGEVAIINEHVARDLPMRVGNKATILRTSTFSNFELDVECDDGEVLPLKASELNKISNEDKQYMDYIFTNAQVMFGGKKVKIVKVNYLTRQVEVKENNGVEYIVEFKDLDPIYIETDKDEVGYFENLGLQIGKLVDKKQKAYGDSVTKCYQIMKVLLQDYYNENDNTYTFPESLLPQMLLDIRKIDKMNRRFSNPDGDLMGENSFQDDVGYSMLGVRMIESLNK